MGLLSASTSVTRYKVNGKLKEPIIDAISQGLKKHAIPDIDGNPSDQAAGWTSFQKPFEPNFDGSSFLIGTYVVFSMRLDKKAIPSKLIQKCIAAESAKRMKTLDRDFLSRDEKKNIKEHVINVLNLKMPAIPNTYDVVWQYEKGDLWVFTNLKNANEHLESLFFKSFGLNPIRQIPYTMAAVHQMSAAELETLNRLATKDA